MRRRKRGDSTLLAAIVAGAIFVSGTAFTWWGFGGLIEMISFARSSTVAQAEVIDLDTTEIRRRRAGTTTFYSPVVRFDVNGYTFRSTVDASSLRRSKWKPGERIRIRYLNGDPETTKSANVIFDWFAAITLLVVGIPIAAFGAFGLRFSRILGRGILNDPDDGITESDKGSKS